MKAKNGLFKWALLASSYWTHPAWLGEAGEKQSGSWKVDCKGDWSLSFCSWLPRWRLGMAPRAQWLLLGSQMLFSRLALSGVFISSCTLSWYYKMIYQKLRKSRIYSHYKAAVTVKGCFWFCLPFTVSGRRLLVCKRDVENSKALWFWPEWWLNDRSFAACKF